MFLCPLLFFFLVVNFAFYQIRFNTKFKYLPVFCTYKSTTSKVYQCKKFSIGGKFYVCNLKNFKKFTRAFLGPAPQPPTYRRRNPPTELVIPCEFCGVPVPHEELIEHETGCRPDLARFNPRRRSPEPDDYFIAPQPSSPEVELPCEFCGDMVPASQLLRHQVRCTT